MNKKAFFKEIFKIEFVRHFFLKKKSKRFIPWSKRRTKEFIPGELPLSIADSVDSSHIRRIKEHKIIRNNSYVK